jgi:hypothetical protein
MEKKQYLVTMAYEDTYLVEAYDDEEVYNLIIHDKIDPIKEGVPHMEITILENESFH